MARVVVSTHVAFVVTLWMVVNLTCGTRKGESVRLPGDESDDDWFTLASLVWKIKSKIVDEPTDDQLDSLDTRGAQLALIPAERVELSSAGGALLAHPQLEMLPLVCRRRSGSGEREGGASALALELAQRAN